MKDKKKQAKKLELDTEVVADLEPTDEDTIVGGLSGSGGSIVKPVSVGGATISNYGAKGTNAGC